jgi:threonine dehydrogenase-like Zn-dependent dehydrogenase
VDLVIETAGTGVAVERHSVTHRAAGWWPDFRTGFFPPCRVFAAVRGEVAGREVEDLPGRSLLAGNGPGRLVTHRFPLARIQEAFAAHRSPEAIKVAVVT